MKEQVHGGDVYRHPGVLDFSSNVNPLGPPAEIIEAAAESLKNIQHYPDVQCKALRTAVSQYEGLPSEQLIFGSGAAEIIFSIVFAQKPKKALLQAPSFAEYGQALKNYGCQVFYCDTRADGFRIQESYLDSLTEDIDIAFLCNPNNPTGFLIDPDILKKILDRCRDKNIRLVVDECFQDFVENEEENTLKKYLAYYPNLFILKAFTKRYAMAGLRLGYGLCGDLDFLTKMEAVTQPWNVSIPAQAAGVKALELRDYVAEGKRIIKEERPKLEKEMSKLGFKVYPSEANYIFFEGPENLQEKCLEKGILIRDCSNYQGLQAGFYRVAVKMPKENEKLKQVLAELQKI